MSLAVNFSNVVHNCTNCGRADPVQGIVGKTLLLLTLSSPWVFLSVPIHPLAHCRSALLSPILEMCLDTPALLRRFKDVLYYQYDMPSIKQASG